MTVSNDAASQFRSRGYCVLPGLITEAELEALRQECGRLLREHIESMDRTGAERLGLSHRHSRYSVPSRSEDCAAIRQILFGDVLVEIVRTLLGDTAYLFLELFAVKAPGHGLPFSWHQDSGYLLGTPHRPYLSLWFALDDTTADNGALWVRPFPEVESALEAHTKDKVTNDFVGYTGDDPGLLLEMKAGSVVAMNSLLFHRSGPNTTDQWRRAFLASYTLDPIVDRHGRQWDKAVPVLRDGQRVG